MFGILGAAFGLGQSIAGLKAPKQAEQVADAENALNSRIAGINARRIQRENSYSLGAQKVQAAAMGGGQYGSLLGVFADDARKARQRVTNVYLDNAAKAAQNSADIPSQGAANSSALGAAGGLFGKLFGG